MVVQSIFAFLALSVTQTAPLLSITPDGFIQAPTFRINPGTSFVDAPGGRALSLTGSHAGIEVADDNRLALTKSLSIGCWLYLDEFVNGDNTSPGAQVLFRGDDRPGIDPYHLTVMADGNLIFAVEDGRGGVAYVRGEIPLHRWFRVWASLDDATGAMQLGVDGRLVAQAITTIRPFANLDPGARPGLGIGNVEAPSAGLNNQPLHGQIRDLRLFDTVHVPEALELEGPVKAGRD